MLSVDKWRLMSPKMKWDILVTLRGPDQKFSMIKWFTTSVIRAALAEVLENLIGKTAGGMVNDRLGFIILPVPHRSYKEKGVGLDYKEVENEDGQKVIQAVTTLPSYPRTAWFDLSHFADHIQEAAAFLEIPVYYVPLPVWETAMEAENLRDALKILIERGELDEEINTLLIKHNKEMGGWEL